MNARFLFFFSKLRWPQKEPCRILQKRRKKRKKKVYVFVFALFKGNWPLKKKKNYFEEKVF